MADEIFVTPMKTPRLEDVKGRLTALLNIHHEQYGETPTSAGPRFEVALDSREQPYIRRLQVDDKWSSLSLDMGWIENPGYILIENRMGMVTLTNPTEEEKAEVAKHVILISSIFEEPASIRIAPGRFALFELADVHEFSIRSAVGVTPIQLTVFPR